MIATICLYSVFEWKTVTVQIVSKPPDCLVIVGHDELGTTAVNPATNQIYRRIGNAFIPNGQTVDPEQSELCCLIELTVKNLPRWQLAELHRISRLESDLAEAKLMQFIADNNLEVHAEGITRLFHLVREAKVACPA